MKLKRSNKRLEADSLRRRFAPSSLAAQAQRYTEPRGNDVQS